MEHSPAVCLRLISDNLSEVDHHCSLCLFFHGADKTCRHEPSSPPKILRSETPFSDCSFYTCRTAASSISTTSLQSDSSGSSTSTIKARIHITTPAVKRQSLRRKQSPTDASLRELNHSQEILIDLRTRQSEERLQAVYERQIMQYLHSDIIRRISFDDGDIWTIEE
ncbi:uncharacterized protein MYCFIDRAFT_211679 [Pseudocercospora fijiensis CIRAD86]|uniref:Uncharacterized protein n=1 Tax=Pseudocercospora fijiensis (strain CIRAD86) TaxID=383855 RepID=M3A8A2_PSEFD|nr:uncharacterized protein MYCFIDRAFT_211679 [Pseudocercospora fijiensis CIRAD86]EME80836.1 hypothetical protein MYCFIDRAFT_211679 [Pseudocercospora fijiensis CIRAD86]